ncbi:zinc-binding dehydrogenase [Spirilliplanes yamanashiensis]|uniref:Alcohol dehydrogenase-like C-terminal domain-containing protein n=1 Tax=Spirilliplanes yamanashiensis TaxID=42233 RepID=A0A8J4DJ97_9ACTN|nr:zinc-binding dehydrogenase [Spirilliplanes yamanashiensis]MDP9817336.1 NADPH:quinone reductase-like Zn-dependent oxidoreductase [Spirilliplanes yamanashiensis]GIJ03013.1 hypothetical protein Sya03_23650 [Spirilliplanes yamanashiensis]
MPDGWVGLHHRAGLRAGETLLVHAAAGGVGSAAVQLGAAAGARVVGVAGGPDKAAVARRLGAEVVVDRTAHSDPASFVAALREACGPGGADVVYDPVGGAAFAAGDIPRAAANHALVKNYGVLGLHGGLYRSRRPEVVRAAAEEPAGLVARGAVDTTGRVVVEVG